VNQGIGARQNRGFGPEEYMRERVAILKNQIEQVDQEIEGRRADHDSIIQALKGAKNLYTSALTDEGLLAKLSLGKDYTERIQRMNQIIRGVNTGIFDEVRVFKAFLKSLNAERRRLQREVETLGLRLKLL